ncbi:MAG: hypothetical protein KAT77_04855 [Nanoarchaeota archaeon]|nr:hypothetical protein [Nanoarchaeota archaeon]
MNKLIATGTDESGFPKIGVLIESPKERNRIKSVLRNAGFYVYCFEDVGKYKGFREENQLDANLASGHTSVEMGGLISLVHQRPEEKYCAVNTPSALLGRLGLQEAVGFFLAPGYSDTDLVGTIHQMVYQ